MKLGYNTNGLACHRWQQALELLAETGYRAVALTLDHHLLDPYSTDLAHQLGEVRRTLDRLQLSVVVETGARFLLNPKVKHDPTLLSPTPEQRNLRVDFLIRSLDIAAEL
ncbi:MAG: sugar phosphate isomerase/epimerase, partial [Planctomycetaceae bacterium]|nr:sugar phosphate isomerase/epimerase [Planctomycetaceae bacterium]